MAKRKSAKKKTVKLTVEDSYTRKMFAAWMDEGIGAAENAIDSLKKGMTKESSKFVKPNIQYWKNVISGLSWMKTRMRPKG